MSKLGKLDDVCENEYLLSPRLEDDSLLLLLLFLL
jgi:hypothetical protein